MLDRVTRGIAVVCVAALGWGGVPANAQDEPAETLYDVLALGSLPGAPQSAGDVVTVESSKKQTTTMISVLPDGETSEREKTKGNEYRYVERHDSVEDGVWSRTIHVEDWTVEEGAESDRSLTGATIRVVGREWELLAGDEELSAWAKRWIEAELLDDEEPESDDRADTSEVDEGEPDDEGPESFEDLFKESMSPDAPVAIGTEWELESEGLAASLGKKWSESMRCTDYRGTGRLVTVDGGDDPTAMHVVFAIEMDVESISGRGRSLAAAPGSRIVLEIDGEGPIGANSAPSRMDVNAQIDVEIAAPGGATLHVDGVVEWAKSETPGGEIPELPESTDD